MERGGVPDARLSRKVLDRPATPAALFGPDDVSRQPRGTPPGRARGGTVRQEPDPVGRRSTRPGCPVTGAAVTDGWWSCHHGIVVYTRQTGASESHAVMRMPRQRADAPRDCRTAIRSISRRARPDGLPDHGSRLLGRRPAPGPPPHRQAGVTETRRVGGSGAPGIPHPIERRPRASPSILFVRRRGCRRGGPRRRPARPSAWRPVAPGATGSARPRRVPRWPRRCSARPSARFSTPRRASRRWWTRRAR